MKKLSKAFSILLVITLLASVMVMPSFAAAPALENNTSGKMARYWSFNTPSTYTTTGNLQIEGGSVTADDHVASIYSKASWDYALKMQNKKGFNFYSGGIRPFSYESQLDSILHHGFEFAMPDTNSANTTISYILNNISVSGAATPAAGRVCAPNSVNTPPNIFTISKTSAGSKIVLFGEFEATLNMADNTWHSVDIYFTKGDGDNKESYMSLFIDGMPLTIKDGKTFDGVHTTTQKFLIDGDSATDGNQGFAGFTNNGARIIMAYPDTGSDTVYLDNFRQYIYAPTNELYLNETRKVYDSNSVVDTECASIPSVMDNTTGVTVVTADDNSYLSLGATNTPRLWFVPRGVTASGFDRVSLKFDARSTTSNVYKMIAQYNYPIQNLGTLISNETSYGWAVVPDMDIAVNKGRSLASLNNQWIPAEFLFNLNNDSYSIKAFDEPQFTVAKDLILAGKSGVWLNIQSKSADSPLDLDNIKISHQNYYPIIKSLTYNTASADDFVALDTTSITAQLDGRIAVTDQSNIDKIKIVAADGTEISATVAYDAAANTLTFSEISGLAAATLYNIVFPADLALSNTVNMGEAYQYSFKTAKAPFSVKSVHLLRKASEGTDFTKETVSYIGDDSTVGAEVTMENISGVDQTFTPILAVYDANGILIAIEPKSVTVKADGTNSVTTFDGIKLTNAYGVMIKVYLWDNLEDMKPLCKSLYLWQNTSWGGEGKPQWDF